MHRGVDLESPASVEDPAGYFGRARAAGPVQWSDAQRGWVVLSHAEVEAAFRDDKRLSADRSRGFQRLMEGRSESLQRAGELLGTWMNFRDAPVQTRLRQPVKGAFTLRAVGELEPSIRSVVAGVMDEFDAEVVDLAHAFARPIPALVIGAIMGVPPGEREHFQAWSHDLARLVFSTEPGMTPDEAIGEASDEFIAFFGELIERERREPSGSLLTTIVHETGHELSEFELIGACTLLLFAGHETTTTLIGNALGLLLEREDLLRELRANPALDETAVEEFMRAVGPARAMIRKVSVEHERGGRSLERGQRLYLCIAAANHDEQVFHEPGRINLARDPNPHLGFGWGPHFCLGANLARLEARIALRMLLDRFSAIEPEGPLPELEGSVVGFGRRPLHARLNA